MSKAYLPPEFETKITIICTEEQEEYIRKFGCIASDGDSECEICNTCSYSTDNIEYRRN